MGAQRETHMRTRITPTWIGCLLGLALAACGGGGDPYHPSGDLERDTFDLVNRHRTGMGLTALVWTDTITEVARGHSQDMAAGLVDFGHAGFYERVDELGQTFAYASIGENVHHNFGYDDPASVALEGWLGSPPHRETLEGDFDLSGLGVAEAEPGEYYFTQMFLREQ